MYVAFLPKSECYLTAQFYTTANPENAKSFENAEDCYSFALRGDWTHNDTAIVVPQQPLYYNCGELPKDALSAISYFLPLGMYAYFLDNQIIISYHADNAHHQRILINVGNLITAF